MLLLRGQLGVLQEVDGVVVVCQELVDVACLARVQSRKEGLLRLVMLLFVEVVRVH